MKRAPSEARKKTLSATSSGVPIRSSGVSSRRASRSAGVRFAVHLGVDDPGSHAVYCDPRGSDLLCQGPGQADHSGFCGGIGHLTGPAGDAPHGGEGHDPPRFPVDKMGQNGPASEKVPSTFVRKRSRQSSSVMSVKSCCRAIPALHIRMSS